jgi:hypothetical protein
MSLALRLYGPLATVALSLCSATATAQDRTQDAAALAEQAAQRSLTLGQHGAAAAGTARPGSLRVTTRFDRPDLTYRKGDTVRLTVETNEDAYVTVVGVGPSGRTVQLFPNAMQTDNLVKANTPVEIPSAASGAQITVNPPFGAELIKVFASEKPITVVPEKQTERIGIFRSLTGGADALIHQADSATAGSDRVAIVNRVIRTLQTAPRRRRAPERRARERRHGSSPHRHSGVS